jgi:hypothetical protein
MIKGYNNTNGALVTYQFTQELMQVDMTQTYPNTNTAGTVGDALNAARAGAFGKRLLIGRNLYYYAADETNIIQTLELDSASAPKIRSSNVNTLTEIPPNNLIMNLDASNLLSYPGSGTTWYDTSGSNSNLTLLNGVTFTNNNDKSYLYFDETDDKGNFSINSSLVTSEATFIIILRKIAKNSGFVEIGGGDTWHPYQDNNGYYDMFRNSRANASVNGAIFPGNTLIDHMVTITSKPGANGWNIYFNNTLGYSDTGLSLANIANPRIGYGRPFKGRIYLMLMYNRYFTQNEVSALYNLLKSRYGL